MRSRETVARKTVDRTAASLQALLGAGIEHVEIVKVLGWLGYAPAEPGDAGHMTPDPRADPMTGIMWPGAEGSSPPETSGAHDR